MMAGESARDSGLTAQQEMNRVMVEIMNRLKTEIEDRFAFLLDLHSVAGALLQVKKKERNYRRNVQTLNAIMIMM